MIVEPTPTNPPTSWRRALRMGGLALPMVLLAVVAAAGIAGPRQAPPAPLLPTLAAVTSAGSPGPSVSPPPARRATPPPPVPLPPSQFGDLIAITTGKLVESARGRDPAAAVAVTGFLRVDGEADRACPTANDPLGPWCRRTGILADWSWTSPSTLEGPVPPFLRLSIPAGVQLPAAVAAAARTGGGGQDVLLVGRVAPATGPCAATGTCDVVLVVESFAWMDGVRVEPATLFADGLDGGAGEAHPFASAIDGADLPLSAALVWPADLAALVPEATRVARTLPGGEPVWYVRVLDGASAPGSERRVRWMLLAERDLRVLASGRPTATRGGGGAAPSSGPGSGSGSGPG